MWTILYIVIFLLFHRPVGVFEFDKFAAGTKSVMDAVVLATEKGTTTIIGKIDKTCFVVKNYWREFYFVNTSMD